MEDDDRTFHGGIPNPFRYGFSIRSSSGDGPNEVQMVRAARKLGRDVFYVDGEGYEREILGAAVHPRDDRMVYVESRAKEIGHLVDVTIRIHQVDRSGADRAVDIESYNPFFGCDVGLIEWFDDGTGLLIYREKHGCFVTAVGEEWPPRFVKIEDRWQIRGDVLSFLAYEGEEVQRIHLPDLTALPGRSLAEAERSGDSPEFPHGAQGLPAGVHETPRGPQ